MNVTGHGISIEVPDGWEARITQRGTGARLHVATFALFGTDGDFGAAATGRMRGGDAFAALVEYVDPEKVPPGVGLFAPRRPRRPVVPDFASEALQVTRPGQLGWQRFFTEAGRTCCLYAVIRPGSERDVKLVKRLAAVLGSLSVASESGAETPGRSAA